MNAKEFFNYVSQMRDLQKEYFKTRSIDVLVKSKEVERIIDKEIDRVKNILKSENNG